jgi:hypothetical protein
MKGSGFTQRVLVPDATRPRGNIPWTQPTGPAKRERENKNFDQLSNSLHLKSHILQNRLPLHFEHHRIAGFQTSENLS